MPISLDLTPTPGSGGVARAVPGAAGRSPETFIAMLREMLRDYPAQDNHQLSGTGTTSQFIVAGCPMNDDIFFAVTVGGVAQTLATYRVSIGAGAVFVDFDTGLLVFGTTPAVGTNNIQITRQRVAYRDSTLLNALTGALSPMRKKAFGRFVDTSITMQTLQWDYTLPSVFHDSDAHIEKVELAEVPITTERYKVLRGWRRVGDDVIQIPSSQSFSPGSKLRISYRAPYRSLSELPESLADLPLWWAMATLLASDQRRRLRVDTPPAAADQGANPWMAPMQTASFYRKLFWEHLEEVARMPHKAGAVSSYAL